MGYVNRDTNNRKIVPTESTNPDRSDNAVETKHYSEVKQRVLRLMAEHHYEKALGLLGPIGDNRELVNAKGVCLLRLGMYHEAVRLYRPMVLSPGCTWTRADLPVVYKTNFATALLLSGQPGGCLELLFEIAKEENATVQRLRGVIAAWKQGLSFREKLMWRCCIVPTNHPITLDFLPGELDVTMTLPDTPKQPSPRASRRDAA